MTDSPVPTGPPESPTADQTPGTADLPAAARRVRKARPSASASIADVSELTVAGTDDGGTGDAGRPSSATRPGSGERTGVAGTGSASGPTDAAKGAEPDRTSARRVPRQPRSAVPRPDLDAGPTDQPRATGPATTRRTTDPDARPRGTRPDAAPRQAEPGVAPRATAADVTSQTTSASPKASSGADPTTGRKAMPGTPRKATSDDGARVVPAGSGSGSEKGTPSRASETTSSKTTVGTASAGVKGTAAASETTSSKTTAGTASASSGGKGAAPSDSSSSKAAAEGTVGPASTKAGQPKNAGSTQATITVTPDRTGDTKSEVLSSKDDGTSAQEKATRTPEWQNFAPLPTPAPNPIVRAAAIRTSTLRRFLRHEWTLAVVAGLVLSVLLNRGALADPRHTLPQDIGDPSLIAYLIAWGGHALGHDPTNLWNLNAFFPMPYGLAFSDSLLGYAPAALFGSGLEAAVLRYNIIFILAQALVFIGAYALARQLGVGRVGGTVAAVAFAVAPWRLGQAGHLHVLSTGGIALALAMLARGHGIRWRGRRVVGRAARWAGEPDPDAATGPDEPSRPPKRPAWALAGWFVAAWQLTIGFGIGLVFLYVLLGAVIVNLAWWGIRRRTPPSWRLLVADGVGGVVFGAAAVLLAQPYLKVLELFPNAKRTDEWIALYSPPAWGFVTAPEHSLVWGGLHSGSRGQLSLPGEMSLLPGFTLYALAVAGLVFSVWSIAVRIALLAGVAVSLVLALGTNGPAGGKGGYLFLLHYLPGFEGLRTPGRLIIWTTLLLALLAAGGVGALVARAGEVAQRRGLPRPTTLARLALLLPIALILAEGIGTTPHQAVPAAPAALSNIDAPFLVLPTAEISDEPVMLWSTDGFPALVNGGSGFVPADLERTRKTVATFPDAESITYLRDLGVHTVVLLRSQAAGTDWEDAAEQPVDDLGITREEIDDTVVFHLNP